MREENIENMNFRELRKEVLLLRDELAIFKRKYEDAIYNLDGSNFGKSFTVEQDKMKAQIKISADAIKTMVSNTDLATELEKYSTIVQTAEKIETAVIQINSSTDEKLKNYSTVTQTADAIHTVVSKGANLNEAIKITSLDEATDTEAIYVIQETNEDGKILSETYYYFNDLTNQWEILSGDSIYTVFNQTAEGFSLKGNVVIDGNTVVTKNLTLSGIVTWDMDNSPVKSQYSTNGSSWHSAYTSGDMYMRMTFDDGKSWGSAVKIVGTDGKNGRNGTDGKDGVVDYSQVNAILQSTYGITSTTLSKSSISSPTIYSAEIYSPNIYGEQLTLVTQNRANNAIYNNLHLTPTSMYLKNAYGGSSATKFYLDLGTDTSNSSIKMRLGAGTNSAGAQALNIEKYTDEIRIGTYVNSSGSALTDFAGMIIEPSTGKITFTGTVQAIAVFG